VPLPAALRDDSKDTPARSTVESCARVVADRAFARSAPTRTSRPVRRCELSVDADRSGHVRDELLELAGRAPREAIDDLDLDREFAAERGVERRDQRAAIVLGQRPVGHDPEP